LPIASLMSYSELARGKSPPLQLSPAFPARRPLANFSKSRRSFSFGNFGWASGVASNLFVIFLQSVVFALISVFIILSSSTKTVVDADT
jgi:hypothetical protein